MYQNLELNETSYHYVDTTAKKILEKINNNFKLIINEKNIKFTYACDDIDINTDETHIIQVLSNLLTNSLEFIPKNDGKIEIKAEKEEKNIVFSVKDNGIGISEENQKNLFIKFYQIDTSLTRKHGGSGLGLTICKGIVEGLGGKIWLESKEGKGSIFYFTIPIKNSESTSS